MSSNANAELTTLDFVAVVVAGLATLALAVFPLVAASFASVFRDLGGTLPLFTRIVLTPWLQPMLAALSTIALVWGVRSQKPIRNRRMALAAAFALSFFAFAASVIGLYLPIFALAGSIKAD